MNVTANTAHSILLSHTLTQSGVYYKCDVTEMKSGKNNTVVGFTARLAGRVTELLPDTTYRVDCVAYHSNGVEFCREANTTVTTRESLIRLCTFSKRECMYIQVSM